jgi:hypothetical protein
MYKLGLSSSGSSYKSKSKSELLYDWRYTASQLVLASSPLRLKPCGNSPLKFSLLWHPCYIASGRLQQKTPFPNNSSLVIEVCLIRRCIETAILRLLIGYSLPHDLFIEPLSSNGRQVWFHYSGFQASCHNNFCGGAQKWSWIRIAVQMQNEENSNCQAFSCHTSSSTFLLSLLTGLLFVLKYYSNSTSRIVLE